MCRCRCSAPFGRPVVPPVKNIIAKSSAAGSGWGNSVVPSRHPCRNGFFPLARNQDVTDAKSLSDLRHTREEFTQCHHQFRARVL